MNNLNLVFIYSVIQKSNWSAAPMTPLFPQTGAKPASRFPQSKLPTLCNHLHKRSVTDAHKLHCHTPAQPMTVYACYQCDHSPHHSHVSVLALTWPLRGRWADKNKDAADKALQPRRTPAEVATTSHIHNFIASLTATKKKVSTELQRRKRKYLIFIYSFPAVDR